MLEDEAGEGATQFHDYEDGGIGDGEGKKDVSDKIESEDQASVWGCSCLNPVKLKRTLEIPVVNVSDKRNVKLPSVSWLLTLHISL